MSNFYWEISLQFAGLAKGNFDIVILNDAVDSAYGQLRDFILPDIEKMDKEIDLLLGAAGDKWEKLNSKQFSSLEIYNLECDRKLDVLEACEKCYLQIKIILFHSFQPLLIGCKLD